MGILGQDKVFAGELTDYCEGKKIDLPAFEEDRIPEVILVPVIRYLQAKNTPILHSVKVRAFPE